AATFSNPHLWGEPAAREPDLNKDRVGGKAPPADGKSGRGGLEADFTEDMAATKFAGSPLVTYRTQAGETLFALQLHPDLAAAPARPRDILFLVDTSASQVQGPLLASWKLVEAVVKAAGDKDHFALWTANVKTTRLTGDGFVPAAKMEGALKALEKETPL